MADDLAYMPAAELATLIRTRRLSPVELMTATLARIVRAQPVLNAFITVAEEQALAGARAAEAAVMRGEPLEPLHGLPVSIKDLVPTAGIRTTWGSRVFAEHVPEADAEVVTRLKASGAIVVGKTTTPEFGQQCLTQAPLFGRTRNAWDAGRTSGGSSGGAAVAAAAGLTALAVATDGGGSTRIPAACNGVVGFKQGLGVVPQEYAQDGFGNISYVTPMTRTVRDTALMLDAMAGPDPRDPLSAGRPQPGFVAALDTLRPGTKPLAGLRVGWRPLLGNAHVAADVLAACERAVAALADLGAETRVHEAPFENPEALWFVSNGAYRRAQFGHHLAHHREILCPTFVRQMDRVCDVSAAELYAAIFARTGLFRQVQSWFSDIDVLAMPTLSRTALPIDQDFFGPITIDGRAVPNLRAAWYPYTMPFNLTGNPAVSLPCGFDEAGLPVAIQLVGPVGEDARLLQVAAAFERAMPWADRHPSLPEFD